MSILRIVAREILDSRGNPTVEVDLHTQKGKHTYLTCNVECFDFFNLLNVDFFLNKQAKKKFQLFFFVFF